MFSPALGRAFRSTSCIPISPPTVCTLVRPVVAGRSLHQQNFARPDRQRRLSSSKASIPLDGVNRTQNRSQQTTEPDANKTPVTKKPASEEAAADKTPAAKVTARTPRKRTVAPTPLESFVPPTRHFDIPYAPSTEHLDEPTVACSSFFSLHRPIVATSPVPVASTTEFFDSVFQKRDPHGREAALIEIRLLGAGLRMTEAAMRMQGPMPKRDDRMRAAADFMNLEGLNEPQVREIMVQCKPFRPPPAPISHSQVTEPETSLTTPVGVFPMTHPQQRSWSTAVVVTESTDASGRRTYSASTSPMVELGILDHEIIPEIMPETAQETNEFENTQRRPGMFAISVKRQRKLKMKKHKYKKLMKRTRLLRRKLDRL